MSIASEITRLQTAKADLKTAIQAKGVTVGQQTLDQYAALVAAISGGANLQTKSITITENGTINVTPDTGYDGLSSLAINTNVAGMPDGITTGTFTCSPATMTKEVSIEHGLGVIPRYVFVGTTAAPTSSNNQEIAFAVTFNDTQNPHSYLLCLSGDIVDCTSSKTADTASNIYLPNNGGSAWYFLANTYRWIAIA